MPAFAPVMLARGLMERRPSRMLEVLREDYVRTARAKGLSPNRVVFVHGLRNALIPVVTLVALQIPAVFGGAIVTEQIFRIPGIGSLLINAMLANDTPVVMAPRTILASASGPCSTAGVSGSPLVWPEISS